MLTRSFAVIAVTLLGCGSPPPNGTNPDRVARVVTSAEGDMGVVVDGHNAFAWELYDQLRADAGDGDVFFSPFSVTSALAMTMAGAEGTTQAEMQDVLHVAGDESAWHGALGALTRDLNGDLDRGYTLNIANRLFGQAGLTWDPAFLDVCDADYGAPLEPWDFASDPEGGRTAVNDWVAAQTHDKIVDLLPEGSVTPLTRIVLANAIYFRGDWATAFDPDDTYDQPFTRLDGSQVDVPTMHMSLEALEGENIEVGYAERGWVVRLPYQDDELSMILLIPAEVDGLPDLEAGLDPAAWAAMTASLGPSESIIAMPRVQIDYKADLVPSLGALGMPTAFTEAADFTGMTPDEPLYVTGVVHQAFVKIDETGTEAAAATAVVGDTTVSANEEILADRPFLFVIQDDLTGAILFIGRVTDPS